MPLDRHTAAIQDRLQAEKVPPILHRYLNYRGYAVPGDVALCGHVKDTPTRFPQGGKHHPGYQTCAICLERDGAPW